MSTAELDPLFARVPVLAGRACSVAELGGGLTNRNLHVTTDDGGDYVVRISSNESTLLAIDRANERHNTRAAWEAGVGAPVVAALPEDNVLVVGFLQGRTLEPADIADPAYVPRIAAAVRTLHQGPEFAGTFDMRSIRRRYLDLVQERGFRLPDDYLELAPLVERVEELLAVRPEPLVPCNNDLLAANFIDDGSTIWIIDYEYSGMNEASFELGNIASESSLDRRHDRCPRRGLLGSAVAAPARAGARVVAHGALRLDVVGLDPGRRLHHRLRLLGLGHGEVRLREVRAARVRPTQSCWRDWRRMTDLPARARVVVIGGGVGGTSIAHHLAERGETDVLLLDRGELTSGSTFHSAGLVGQLRGSVTLTRMMMDSADLYRRLAEDPDTDPGWVECGGIRLACSPARMEELERQVGWAETFGLPLQRLSASRGAGPVPTDVDGAGARRDLPRHRRLPRPVAAGLRPRDLGASAGSHHPPAHAGAGHRRRRQAP